MMQFFLNTFKDNIAQVPAVINDTILKPFTEVVHGFAGHRGRNGGDFLSYYLLNSSIVPGRRARRRWFCVFSWCFLRHRSVVDVP